MESKALKMLSRDPKENNRDYAYRVLKYNILTMWLTPGSTINENDYAAQLGVSRTPIHEALTILKSEYLVDIFPQSGSRVSLINFQNIKDGVFLRNVVEPAIYKELENHLTTYYSNKMEENLNKTLSVIEKGNKTDDVGELFRLDDEFHYLAYEATNKVLLWNSVKIVCSHFDRIRYAESVLKKSNLRHVYDEHMMLYEYILVGGMPNFDFEKHYDDHLSFFKGFFFKMYKEFPQYFEIDDKNHSNI